MYGAISDTKAYRQTVVRTIVHLHAFGSRQGNAGIVAYTLEVIRQE